MPYIKSEDRTLYDRQIAELVEKLGAGVVNPGHLNYVITKLIHECLPARLSYAHLNEMIGVLDCAKMELYRMVAAPYEDYKREVNGNISDLDDGTIK